jgi:hypothetical protein
MAAAAARRRLGSARSGSSGCSGSTPMPLHRTRATVQFLRVGSQSKQCMLFQGRLGVTWAVFQVLSPQVHYVVASAGFADSPCAAAVAA